MQIPAYQIQNVLRLYFKQLGEGKILEKSGRFVMSSDTPRAISSEGTRQTIIDKVAAGIAEKIISEAAGPLTPLTGRQIPLSAGKPGHNRDKIHFTYLLIDRHNTQTLRTAKDIHPHPGHAFSTD
ncbi:MAG: hypothetical protein K9K63_15075 [Desulfotignum sp.]|nr:hypothetical protein [Desulfotignum sp.]MCF8089338.1 hypothetical protein [Desulfotignum sp.]MCF8138625.1 hypothetical protein [Desulfotignum sp.]